MAVDWIPNRLNRGGPCYLQIVAAIMQDIASGVLAPGTRLLPHRGMPQRFGLGVGAASKSYDEAEKRNLVFGNVGRTAKLVVDLVLPQQQHRHP